MSLAAGESHVDLAFATGPVAEIPSMIWFGRIAARGHDPGLIRFGVVRGVVYFLGLVFATVPFHVYALSSSAPLRSP
jgi:hypothetical protein